MSTRTLVVWCPDWPVVAAGGGPDAAAAVVVANRVIAVSAVARREGVYVGQRRRAAQAACPALTVIASDPSREARAFEPVIGALEAFTPLVELTEPGSCACSTRGPSRYAGGDHVLAARVHAAVLNALGAAVGVAGPPGVGVADGSFAATLAARRSAETAAPLVVAGGQSASFVASFSVAVLADALSDATELVDVLPRLGVRTLGEFAALSLTDVIGRFGAVGQIAHRLASGADSRPLTARRPPIDLAMTLEIDPPGERVEQVAFAVKSSAEELHARLAERGLACTRLIIEIETEHGEVRARCWRHEGALSAAAIAERARWQLDGWLHARDAPTAGVNLIRLVPDEVIPDHGRQLGFWGGQTQADERAWRGLARVGELIGRAAVLVPVWRGGRGPTEQLALVPADTVDLAGRIGRTLTPVDAPPWPGRLPAPSPTEVFVDPERVDVFDGTGASVRVSGRLVVSAAPVAISIDGRPVVAIEAWAGPWGIDEHWWDPRAHRRRARFQVRTADGRALLLALEHGHWWCEARYD